MRLEGESRRPLCNELALLSEFGLPIKATMIEHQGVASMLVCPSIDNVQYDVLPDGNKPCLSE